MDDFRGSNRVWKICEANPRQQHKFSAELGVSPVIAQLLLNRGIHDVGEAQSFLFGDMLSCNDPFLLKDMRKSVSRIKKAVASGEKILIYGDYDVDGVTATALLSYVLGYMGAEYDTFIPNRLEEGYGMNVRAVALAREKGVKLLITVDCGINSFKEVECANSYGIDVIVTDHHEIKENRVPEAFAVIDAHQAECRYPFKHLSGVGVAYKLARALLEGEEQKADEHLDLVALGTVADIVPLSGENRVLVKYGLKDLRKGAKQGLSALMKVAKIRPDTLDSWHISFILAPRINAMGRVGSANTALELLMCDDHGKAMELAAVLDRENRNRQSIEKELLKEATGLIEEHHDVKESRALVLAGEGWHQGVLGIVASRITEEHGIPSILISFEGENGKGSGRSVDGFNLFETLRALSGYLVDFGGHEGACGLKIKKDKVPPFSEEFYAIARRHFASRQDVRPELRIDLKLPFSSIGMKLLKELELMRPYGPENAEPVFATSGLMVKNYPREIGRGGFKFLANCGTLTCEAITFRKNRIARPSRGDIIDLAYTPQVNVWDGIETIQLNIKDLQPA